LTVKLFATGALRFVLLSFTFIFSFAFPDSFFLLRSSFPQGSEDEKNWTLLSEHVDDDSLNKKGASKTFAVSVNHAKSPFRYFRIFQYGVFLFLFLSLLWLIPILFFSFFFC
jgi:hypothetical protein